MKISEAEFRELLAKSTVPVVADFYAEWCGPCKAFGPMFERVGKQMAPGYAFCKVNIDEAGNLCNEVGVRVVPTLMIFNGKRKVASHEGSFASEAALETFVKKSAK